MKPQYWTCIFLMLFAGSLQTVAQQKEDTVKIINAYSKAMSFSSKPYLYYTAVLQRTAKPVMDPGDTGTVQTVFYKSGTDIYYDSGSEENFLQDSFYVQINRERKSIWIGKVDMDSKKKVGLLPWGKDNVQEMMQKDFIIQKKVVNDTLTRFDFEKTGHNLSTRGMGLKVTMYCNEKKQYPYSMQVEMNLKEPIDDEMMEAIKTAGMDLKDIIVEIDRQRYAVKTETMIIKFSALDFSKEKAMAMPGWKERVEYLPGTQEFRGKGIYEAYEITKTF